jgi:YD repeat-containing protein
VGKAGADHAEASYFARFSAQKIGIALFSEGVKDAQPTEGGSLADPCSQNSSQLVQFKTPEVSRMGDRIPSRLRAIITFGLLLSACIAAPGLAATGSTGEAQGSAAASAEVAETQTPPATEEPAPGPIPSSPDEGGPATLEGELESLESEASAHEKWLATPEAIEERDESRTAFDDLTAGEAEALLSETFEKPLEQLDGDPARVLTDLEIEEVVGEHAVLVPDPEGGSELVESPIPVRSEVPGEEAKPVDLALQPTEDGFTPDTPATTEIRLPDSLGGEVQLGDGLGFKDLPGDPGVSSARFGDKDLFFSESATDTDTLIAPLSFGVEVFEQLRSPASPEQFRFGLSLPEGSTLGPDGSGGAEVVDAGGRRIASVPTPYAIDAQGTEVPVSLEVDGADLVLSVPHRSADFAYPILVDPELVNEEWYWANGNIFGLGYWGWQENADYEGRNDGGCFVPTACWGAGLYARSKGSNYWYGANTYGRWVYSAPNSTAYISAATLWDLHGSVGNCPTYQPHGWVGLWNGNSYSGLGVFSPLSFYVPSYSTGWVGSPSTRWIHVGIGTAGSASQLACGHDFYVAGATIHQDDPENPGVSVSGGDPSGWITDSTAFTIKADGSDPGLGVRKITFTRDGSPPIERYVGCNGSAASRCPTFRTENFNVTGLSFDEGKKTASIVVEDATARKSTHTWNTYVDRTKPDITLSGQLANATNEGGGEEHPPGEGDELSLPVYNLDIKATDVGPESNADARKRSGVRKLQVLLDGVKKDEWTQSCADSCSMEKTYPLKLNNLDTGEHVLEVLATDGVEKTRERKIEFEYIPATGMKDDYAMHYFPLPDGSGNEDEEEHPSRPELAVNIVNGNLVYRQKDVDVSGYAADLEVERYYNSLLPEEENTEWGDGWTLAQTPDLEPEQTGGQGAPAEAMLIRSSGAVEDSVLLPTSVGSEEFDPELQAVVTKEPGGGYEIEDASGETGTAMAFDAAGNVEELRTESAATVEYAYEEGALAEIAVEDPATLDVGPAGLPADDTSSPAIVHAANVGTTGQGDGQLDAPSDVATDPQGNLWVLDKANNRIQKFSSSGQFLTKVGGQGTGDGQFNGPAALAIDPAGNLWVADQGNNRVQKFSASGQFLSKFGVEVPNTGYLIEPNGIAVGVDGSIWVSDWTKVQRFTPSGEFIERVGSGGTSPGQIRFPQGLAIDSSGNAYIADSGNDRIDVFDEDGDYLRLFGSSGAGPGQFAEPTEVEVDEGGNVWVGDSEADRVQLFNSAGDHVTSFGSSGAGEGQFGFDLSLGIASDGQGRVWISDPENDRVQMWLAGHYESSDEEVSKEDDPQVEVETSGGLVEAVEGDDVGTLSYEHSGDLLTAVSDPEGETAYEYNEAGRMTKVTLPNGTYAEITYEAAYGRVKSVTVAPDGGGSETTTFTYSDDPRKTTVVTATAPAVTYQISEDGSVFKWQNALQPPEFEDIAGTLYDVENRETADPIAVGEHNLSVQAYSEEGIKSIGIYADGKYVLSEKTCEKGPESDCRHLPDEWVVFTGDLAPGILNLEIVIEDYLGQVASKRFWVSVPYTPPPAPGEPQRPLFADVLEFREEHGLDLDLDPVQDELELNDRVFDTINDWIKGEPVAVASMERWGAPLRGPEVAELEYRQAYWQHAVQAIPAWAEANSAATFAGYYLDERGGGLMRVGFTADEAQRINSLKDGISILGEDRIVGFKTSPMNSIVDLRAIADQVTAAGVSNASAKIYRVGIASEGNEVRVGSAAVSTATALLHSQFGSGAPITVYEASPEFPMLGRERITGKMVGGERIEIKEPGEFLGECTTGFGAFEHSIKPGDSNKVFRLFALTAAHCGEINSAVIRRRNPPPNEKDDRVRAGYMRRHGYDQHKGSIKPLDVTAVKLENAIEPRRIYLAKNRPLLAVRGMSIAGPGTVLCHSGATSDDEDICGPILIQEPENYIQCDQNEAGECISTPIPLLQWRFEAPLKPGDSGGPVWIEGTNLAFGINSSGRRQTFAAPIAFDSRFPDMASVFRDPSMGSLDGLTMALPAD